MARRYVADAPHNPTPGSRKAKESRTWRRATACASTGLCVSYLCGVPSWLSRRWMKTVAGPHDILYLHPPHTEDTHVRKNFSPIGSWPRLLELVLTEYM
jgi:hypothetical protein